MSVGPDADRTPALDGGDGSQRGALPGVWVVCPHLGAASEPWLWRQIVGLRRLRPSVITAERHDTAQFPTPGIAVVEDRLVRPQENGLGRWRRRLLRAAHRNFFALDRRQVDRFAALAVEEPPDVLLCHFGHIAVRFLPLARRLGIPLVAHFHGMDLSSSLRNRWYRWSLQTALPRFAAVVVVGSHQRALIESMGYPSERIHQIPCGVPVDDFRLRAAREEGGRTRFVTVCRLVPWKGVDISMRALARLRQEGIDAELRVVGDGAEQEALQRLASELGVAERVQLLGPLPPPEVRRQLGEADVFLQHSREQGGWVEGFGVSITEASATGLPVIVSDCGGITDQVEDGITGFVVGQGDVDAMAERMQRLAADPQLRRSLGLAGSRRARERFNTPDQIEKLELVVLQVRDETLERDVLPGSRRTRRANVLTRGVGRREGMSMFRGTAVWRLLARSETLRSIKRKVVGSTARPGRRRIPTALGVQGLLDAMNQQGIDYAVLRWFDHLPEVDEGEDLDVLVSDEDAPLLDRLLTRSTEEGTIPCDVYSVGGRAGFLWKNTAYYPPHLAAGLLDRSVTHRSGARVLCARDHFHTLAFHALYHKGYASGLPVSATEGPRSDEPEHDYLRTLSGLADELGLDVAITMEDLDRHLARAGWRPALDTLAKWSLTNPWVEELHDRLIGDDPSPVGLTALVVRERAADPDSVEQIARLAREHGMIEVARETLTSEARERASRSLRGGNWGPGPYPTSGGEPAVVLVVVDPSPLAPSPEQLAAHPGLDNGRLPVFKDAVRRWWNEKQPPAERCNILHTSDSAAHARHYFEEVIPDRVEHVVRLAAEVQATSARG